MKRAVPLREPQLFSTMNVTPFIDVMLVLLVMLIITIPMQTHAVKVDMPTGTEPTAGLPHKLMIDRAGALYWDGRRVRDSELPALLTATVQEKADLQVQTDPETRYERFDQVLAVVKANGVTQLGFVNNEQMKF
ncbi:biopolymer transporter ExbD [Sphingomonas sp. LB-2]|uniref:ExbD/TolR family protein n=1 Tax=Sphingomonas caeni TaxID=2984949 RepID=UPI0022312B8E|nr:biopolymer transporter ExbD [Sphingomonas caeni]MCW3847121.1 biopolymer transporter ExbD [Sphingomonas caeni]